MPEILFLPPGFRHTLLNIFHHFCLHFSRYIDGLLGRRTSRIWPFRIDFDTLDVSPELQPSQKHAVLST